METIEHNSENAIITGGEWIPVLRGDIFCSPACGGKCKEADFFHATE